MNTKTVSNASGSAHFFSIRTMTKIGILSALSVVVMLLEIPLPFAPPFYKLDLSEIIVMLGGFALY